MAVGMFILSQKQRQKLSIIFIMLNIFQIIIGCGMTGSSLYIIIAVAPVLHQEKSEINFVFAVTGLYGTHVMFHWIVGINIGERCLKSASRKTTSNFFLLWTCLGTGTILQLLILSHFARKMNKYISRSIKQSITTGMNQYLQDISWKEVIDKLQYNNECCGLRSFQDWHEAKWLTTYHVDIKSTVVKQFRINDEVLTLPVVPWSCCKVEFPMQCLHDPIQQTDYAHLWVDEPTVVTDSINTKGCLDILKKPITWTINAFVTAVSLLTIIHVITFVVSRLLYTSSRNAILLGDPEGSAPGWVFGRGDCGYMGGKTVFEIMENRPINLKNIEHTENETEATDTTNNKRSFKIHFFKKRAKSNLLEESDKNDADTILSGSKYNNKLQSMKGEDGDLKRKENIKASGESTKTPNKVERNATLVSPQAPQRLIAKDENVKASGKSTKILNKEEGNATPVDISSQAPTRKKAKAENAKEKTLEEAHKKPNVLSDKTKKKPSNKHGDLPNSNNKGAHSMEEKLKNLQQ